MTHCPSCGAFPGNDHHEACTIRARGLRNRDRSESIQKLIDENQHLRSQLAEARELLDDQARLLFWGEALMRSMSGWPATHPNEFTDWKEDWRIARDKYKALAGGGE